MPFGFHKAKEDPYAVEDVAPKWADRNESNVGGSWTTFDPFNDSFEFDQRHKSGNTKSKIFESEEWNDTKDADADNEAEYRAKFVSDRQVMDDNRAKSDFDVRNAALLGIGADFSIVSQKLRDHSTTVRGATHKRENSDDLVKKPIKRRVSEEKRARLQERQAEQEQWRARDLAWRAMSDTEKDAARRERYKRDGEMMQAFRFEIIETMPDDIEGIGVDLANLTLGQSIPASPRPSSHALIRATGGRRVISCPSGRGILYRHATASSVISEESSTAFASEHVPLQDESIATPQTVSLARSEAEPPRPSQPKKLSFRVEFHPLLIPPPRDLGESINLTSEQRRSHGEKIMKIRSLNDRKGRIVTVRLDPNVTVPFPEAVTARLWGGMIQEVAFDDASKHAVVVFVTASGAAAFLQHWRSIEAHSAMEFRRLQIAADWYDTDEHSAILPAQMNVIRAICLHGASRVLIIRRIFRNIAKEHVEGEFRRSVGLDRVICRGRLIVPTKRYEREADVRCNALVVEFASIRDAVDIRDAIQADELGPDFDGCTAEFTRDPTDRPPVTRDFCRCRWCAMARAG